MIANKILPSFYFVEVRGTAVESVFAGDFGIDEIIIESKDFTTDLDATAALKHALQFITTAPHLDTTEASEKINFNPDFFPSLPKPALTEEQAESLDLLLNEAEDKSTPDKDVIVLTRFFDSFGDFVQSRWEVSSVDFQVIGRVAIDPDIYISEKANEHFTKKSIEIVKPDQIIFH